MTCALCVEIDAMMTMTTLLTSVGLFGQQCSQLAVIGFLRVDPRNHLLYTLLQHTVTS